MPFHGCFTLRSIMCAVLLAAASGAPAQDTMPTTAPATAPTRPQPMKVWKQIELSGTVLEDSPPLSLFATSAATVRTLREQLDGLSTDESVEGVLLSIRGPELGYARVAEIRAEIDRFRAGGKKVYALMSDASQGGYLIAAGCDRVIMAPSGILMLTGLRMEGVFLKNLLDRVGVNAEMISIGKYKSAAEPFTRTQWSQPARESMEALADDLFKQMLLLIASGRMMDIEDVRALIDEGPFTADEAVERGLIDELAYEADVVAELKGRVRGPFRVEPMRDEPQVQPMTLFDLLGAMFGGGRPSAQRPSGDTIALIYAIGPILPSAPQTLLFPEPVITPDAINAVLEECLHDDSIKAIIVRIDSPGGDATSSDIIWRQIRRVAASKPVVASMGDTAASGGYYIAMGASHVVAHPGTITGSIGVLGGKVAMNGLLDKASITTDIISRGRNAGIFSVATPFTESERLAIQRLLVEIYEDFTAKVAVSRNLSAMEVEEAAQGRVWSGTQALSAGLVDELGGLREAIDAAKSLANIPLDQKVRLQVYPEEMSLQEFLQQMLGGGTMAASGDLRLMAALVPPVARQHLNLIQLFQTPRPLALMPLLIVTQ